MFLVDVINDGDVPRQIVLKDENSNSFALIDLKLGGSLQELTLNNKHIIKNLHPFEYKESFASAILFPFVNRIENGTYTFKDQTYQLEANDQNDNHALHGLVYDKAFRIENQSNTKDTASVSILYRENGKLKGFPFKFEIHLTYRIDADSLNLMATIRNSDTEAFPFSLGWHPYFSTNDLFESELTIDTPIASLMKLDELQLKGKKIHLPNKFQIKDKILDDCYHLNANKIGFTTPEYSINYSVSTKDTYLQLYTPPSRNALAIELQTSPANSLNNKIGLQILQPNDSFELSWNIELNQTN